jgi:hypothetical protein
MSKKQFYVIYEKGHHEKLHKDIEQKSLNCLRGERDALKQLGSSISGHTQVRLHKINIRIAKLESIQRIEKWLMTETPDRVYDAYEELKDLYNSTSKRYPNVKEEKLISLLQEHIRPYTLFIRIYNDNTVWSNEYRLKPEYYVLVPRDQQLREHLKKTKDYPEDWMLSVY